MEILNEKILGFKEKDAHELFVGNNFTEDVARKFSIRKNKLVPVVLKKDYDKLKSSKTVSIKEIKIIIKKLKQAVDETDFICSNTPAKVYKEALQNFLFILCESGKIQKKGAKK